MNLYVKNTLMGYKIENNEGIVIDYIKSKNFMDSARLILKDNSIVYETDIIIENKEDKYLSLIHI